MPDLNVPGKNGKEALEEIKRLSGIKNAASKVPDATGFLFPKIPYHIRRF